jgi:hypothetical protein
LLQCRPNLFQSKDRRPRPGSISHSISPVGCFPIAADDSSGRAGDQCGSGFKSPGSFAILPLRIPAAHERLDPPLIDIYVPHGARAKQQKINPTEADVIVNEIATLTAQPEMCHRTIGVISLVGADQAEHIRSRLSETIGEEIMQRHSILCGDSATFQGTERDIVFLSMVADSANKTALTMLRYEQRFNVAVSRGRDRVVLVAYCADAPKRSGKRRCARRRCMPSNSRCSRFDWRMTMIPPIQSCGGQRRISPARRALGSVFSASLAADGREVESRTRFCQIT